MKKTSTILLIASFSVFGQQSPPSAELRGDANVIGIRYHCTSGSSGTKDGACTVRVTKEEFDALIQALDPNMSLQSRQAVAGEYSRVLIMAAEARRRGIDQSPEVQTLLRFSGLQVLANRLVKEINAAAPKVSSDEVERYYRDHARDYQQVSLSRIFVSTRPKDNAHDVVPTATRAEVFRARAIKGEDFSVLQNEITGALTGSTGQNVHIGPISCLSIPEAHREVCSLQPGQISNVFSDSLGYTIYRLESRQSLDLADVRDGIRSMLERQRLQGEIEKVRAFVSLDLDERYFGKLPKPDVASAHGMHFPASTTTAPAPDVHKHQH